MGTGIPQARDASGSTAGSSTVTTAPGLGPAAETFVDDVLANHAVVLFGLE